MAFKEIGQLTTEQEYEAVTKQYIDLKTHIQDAIEFEDFETLSSYDLAKIKELHFQKSALFWKIKVEKIQAQLDEIKKQDKFNYQHNKEYCELVIKKFSYYAEQKQAELKGQGDYRSYDRHHKPVIENKIIEWKLRLESCRSINNEPTGHEEVKVIP